MADEDVYELHVCEGGRWSCVERFRSAEKDEAVAEANRQFASATVEAVRVIREVYDQDEQVFKQRTVFRNAKPKADIPTFNAKSAPPPRRTTPPAGPRIAAAPAKPPPPRPQPTQDVTQLGSIKRAEPAVFSRTFAVVKRLLIAAAVGLLLSGIVFAVVSTPSGARLFDHVQERVVYGGIVALFVASFFVSLYLFSRAESRSRAGRSATIADAPSTPISAADGAGETPQNWADREIPIGGPPGEAVPELPEGAAPPTEPVVDKEALADLQEQAKAKKEVEKVEEKKPPESPIVEELPSAGSADRETLLRFFRDGMMNANT